MQAQFLAFAAHISGAMHRAGLFKIQDRDLYWWTWFDCNVWFQGRIDLGQGIVLPVDQYKEIHNSQHESGEFHVRYEKAKTKKFTMGVQLRKPLVNLNAPLSLPRSPVPLTQPFPWLMQKGPWNQALKPIALSARDFGDGIYLHPYLCRDEDVDTLAARFEDFWVAGNGSMKLLVVAEPE